MAPRKKDGNTTGKVGLAIDKNTKVKDMLKSNNAKKLTSKMKNATYGQVLSYNGWVSGGTSDRDLRFDSKDWRSLINALESEYPGWEYDGSTPASCCCTWP